MSDPERIIPFIAVGPTRSLELNSDEVCALLTMINQARRLLQLVDAREDVPEDYLGRTILGLSDLFETLTNRANTGGMGIELHPVLQAKIDALRAGSRPGH